MTLYTDDFSTDPFAGSRVTTSGGSWSYDGVNARIQQTSTATTNVHIMHTGSPRSAYIEMEWDTQITAGTRQVVGALLQAVDGSTVTGLAVFHVDNTWSVRSRSNGSESNKDSSIITKVDGALTTGVTYHFKLTYDTLVGNGELFVDGISRLTWNYTDTNISTGGVRPGFITFATGAWFDNLAYQNERNFSGISTTGVEAFPLNGSAYVRWNPMSGASSYEYRVNGGSSVSTGTLTNATINSLTNGVSTLIEIRSMSSTGNGAWTPVNVTPSATQKTVLLDTFARSDSASVVGTPTIGGPYTVGTGTWGLNGGRLYSSANTASSRVLAPGGIDISASFKVPVFPNSNNSFGFIFRHLDASNFMMMYVASGTYRVWSNVAASQVLLQDFGSVATTDTLGVICSGRYVYPTKNGKILAAVIDVNYGNGGSGVGAWSSGQTQARMDDLVVYDFPMGITYMGNGTADVPAVEIPAVPHDDAWAYLGRDLKMSDEGAV